MKNASEKILVIAVGLLVMLRIHIQLDKLKNSTTNGIACIQKEIYVKGLFIEF